MAPDLPIPMGRYPGVFIFYQMGRAGLLLGQSNAVDSSAAWSLQAVVDDARLTALHREHPGRVTAQFRHLPTSFARMLAKIGYCQILTSLDPGDFDALCLPYILGAEKNLSHIIGARASIEAPEPGIGYSLRSNLFGDDELCFVVAEIRLFSAAHTPTYHVVVGQASGPANVELVSQKLEVTYRAQLPKPSAFEIPPDEFHWMPASWPIAG
ncbi:hypothetical protein [Duganella fentianensis]|nr:hypothetical protein [Duganella fentianensis]